MPDGRSMHSVADSRNPASTPKSAASVAWMTSFCTSPYSETRISWRMLSCRTLISGSCSASRPSAARSAPLSAARRGTTTVSSVGGAKQWPAPAAAGTGPSAPPARRRPARRPGRAACRSARRPAGPPAGGPAVEHADRGDLALAHRAEPEPFPGPHRPGEHPDVRDLLPGRATLDLEHSAGRRAAGGPPGAGQQVPDAAGQGRDAGPVMADPKNTGCTSPCLAWAASAARSCG